MKYTEILEQLVNEINMSPSSLRQLSAGIDARAGMEFEMIVPNIGSLDDDDYFEPEPDYDQDESISDFDDIRRFFHDGEHNGRRAVERLMDEIEGEYYDSDFLSEKKQEAWGEASYDAIKDLVDRDFADDLRDQATDEVSKDTPEFGVNGEEFEEAVLERYNELVKEKIDEILADMGSEYDEAYEEWETDQWQEIQNDPDTQREWLEYEGHTAMSDISNNYDIEWPHWTESDGNGYGNGEANAQQVADDFSEFINKKVNFSASYHGGRREPNAYVVEPDGSLEGDDAGDQGLEFVSPPMPISELIADLNLVKQWAGRTGCYTNSSTGLHINVSVPNWQGESSKLDYVKLAILLGDEYVLREFGRQGNTYCKSALSIVKNHIKQKPNEAELLLGKMKEHLNTAAAKIIHDGITSKYTSINNKSGYIEFRSPGGDWLDENFEKIENTLLRFVVALDAAVDETKYKEEYAKKLYKLLAPSNDGSDTLQYFAKYSAGEIPKAALRSFIKQAQLNRKLAKDPLGGQLWWWNVPYNGQRMEVVAKNKAVAKQVAVDEWGLTDSQAATISTADIRPIKPYDESPVKATVGEPQAIGRSGGSTVGGRASNPEGAWILARRGENPPVPVYRFNASGVDDANVVLAQWQQEHPGDAVDVHYDPQMSRGQPTTGSNFNTLSQTDYENRLGWPDQTGDANYEIVSRSNGRRQMVFIANTEQDAQRKYSQWLDVNGLPHDTENYGFREIALPGSTIDLQRQRAVQQTTSDAGRAQTSPTGQWKIVDGLNREVYRFRPADNTRTRANFLARIWADENNFDGNYQVEPVEDTQPVRTATVPGQAQQRFTGYWDVKMGDEVVFRVQAETQGEANQKARAWLTQRSPEFMQQHQGQEVSVTPRYE